MNFDLVNTQLTPGITCLEASAGTGKTYALAGLFLRLIVEAEIPASEILVVTFTEAATAELRDRIRIRLHEALAVLQGGIVTSDALLLAMKERAKPRLEVVIQSLSNALGIFDLVSIYTIHSFCQRTLQDSAFESGILFDVELVTDPEPLLREIAADYFRRLIHRGNPLFASVALSRNLTPGALSQMLKLCQTHQQLRLLPAEPPMPLEESERRLTETFAALRKAWPGTEAQRVALRDYFTAGSNWAVRKHAKAEIVEAQAAALAAGLAPDGLSTDIWTAIAFFSLSAVRTDVGKKKQMPEPVPALFELCETLIGLAEDFALGHRLAFLQAARQSLETRKQQAKQQSFDDLISRLATALDRPEGASLGHAVRRKYRAALIDEFQDTDPLQWKIFREFFGGSAEHRLYLIGDPKQAIYGFRGADVQAYLNATSAGERKFSLATNHRSEAPLVSAVNAIFTYAGANTAFVEEGIEFYPAEAAGKVDKEPFTISGERPAAFQVWNWEPQGGPATGKQAKAQLPAAVAAEIARLLTSTAAIGGRPLKPRDFAVLVESHRQAGWIQNALHELKIPSVEQAMESVFESTEARELQWILAAILAPANELLVKAALTTDAMGLNADSLQSLVASEPDWQARLQRLASYRDCWDADGFFFMFARFIREERVIENLLRFTDAERRITNFLHLGELLQAASQAEHLSPLRLRQWLEERRTSDDAAPEACQLRLESDEDAVQIVTIHRSKGLQYPVVFSPFLGKDAKPRKIMEGGRVVMETVLFHDAAVQALTWDLNPVPSEEHQRQAVKELLAELVRLLYVALTRAVHRCYLVSAKYAGKNTTALDWLLLPEKEAVTDFAAALKEAKPAPGQWRRQWDEIAASAGTTSPPAIAVSELPTAPGEPWQPAQPPADSLNPRSCERQLHASWFLASYTQLASRLTSAHADASDQPDHDESATETGKAAEETKPNATPEGIFALPPGARTGDCLHKILEEFDFAAGVNSATDDWVRPRLEAFGLFDEAHTSAVCEMLSRLCRVPLDPARPDFTLARIPKTIRLAELEFHLPAERLDARTLLAAIRNPHDNLSSTCILPVGGSAGFQPADSLGDAAAGSADRQDACATISSMEGCATRWLDDGFLKGFMDLVFVFEGRYFILDWKSNRLGNRLADYSQEAMAREIRHSLYDLQYHLYTVALDRFLRVRLPDYDYERHFGGVIYVFLRGVTPDDPTLGAFRDRPSAETIHRLKQAMRHQA